MEDEEVKYEKTKLFFCSTKDKNHDLIMTGCGGGLTIASLARDLNKRMVTCDGSIGALEDALDWFRETDQYRKAVQDETVHSLLFALRSTNNETALFYLWGDALTPVEKFECVGSGANTAKFFAKWLYDPDLPISAFLPLAIQIFRSAKIHNTGADDSTQIVKLFNGERPKGRVTSRHSDTPFLWGLHELLGQVIHGCFDTRVSEEDFLTRISKLLETSRAIRRDSMRPDVIGQVSKATKS